MIITGATAVAAIGAVAAAIIAALAYRRQTLDRHREHASKFSVWSETIHPGVGAPYSSPKFMAFVKNSSDEPMYRVLVVFRDGRDPTKTLATGDPMIDVLPPDTTQPVDGGRITADPDLGGVYAEAGFNDRTGQRWYRDWRGRLNEHQDPAVG